MWILNANNVPEEGVVLTEQEVADHKKMVELFHQKICSNVHHSRWERTNSPRSILCETMAGVLFRHFKITERPGCSLETLVAESAAENFPQEMPQAPVSTISPDDDNPF